MGRIDLDPRLSPRERPPARGQRGNACLSQPVWEYCEALLCRLLWSEGAASPPARMLGVTSCYRGEGVSTVAAQLAVAAASRDGLPVLLVDANLARPSLHRTFALPRSPGWSDVVGDPRQLTVALQPSGVEHLSVVPAGESGGRAWPGEGADFSAVFKTFKEDFALILFDLPAVGETSAALRLAGLLDGILLVVEAERVRYEVAQRIKELLGRANARLLGAVLNKRRQYVPNWLYRTL